MQIFINTLTAASSTLVLDVAASAPIADVSALIAERELIPCDAQRLIFAGKQLDSELTLADYGITQDATIHLTASLLGGGKKRKKKTYTTPKKIKHKHKKVKLAILKYYKVEDGKITRLRRECPSESCGAGVFMATHHDRLYCGKCGLTYLQGGAKA
ncbi:ubiquitin/40s ribosomal protein S27a fusion [Phlyctochytrium arcticum]|nr:ubiquitin/40s ribosomal protein S27a fusion [Phlyctochytrium arcticum]